MQLHDRASVKPQTDHPPWRPASHRHFGVWLAFKYIKHGKVGNILKIKHKEINEFQATEGHLSVNTPVSLGSLIFSIPNRAILANTFSTTWCLCTMCILIFEFSKCSLFHPCSITIYNFWLELGEVLLESKFWATGLLLCYSLLRIYPGSSVDHLDREHQGHVATSYWSDTGFTLKGKVNPG